MPYPFRFRAEVIVAIVVAVLAHASFIQADPIRFDNPEGPNHFEWFGGTASDAIILDLTLPSGSQTGESGQFRQYANPPFTGTVNGSASGSNLNVYGPPSGHLIGLDEGVQIPSGEPWNGSGAIFNITRPDLADESLLKLTPVYLGVRFLLDNELHYGWIGVKRQNDYELDAFAWGYETTPDTPIVTGVPEPASILLLAFGATCLFSRRRNSAGE